MFYLFFNFLKFQYETYRIRILNQFPSNDYQFPIDTKNDGRLIPLGQLEEERRRRRRSFPSWNHDYRR